MKDTTAVVVAVSSIGTNGVPPLMQIAAVILNPQKGTLGKKISLDVDYTSIIRHGGSIDPNALDMWIRRLANDPTLVGHFNGSLTLPSALTQFHEWLTDNVNLKTTPIVSVDNSAELLHNVYSAAFNTSLWPVENIRSYTTLAALAPSVSRPAVTQKHHADSEARAAAMHVISICANNQIEAI